MVRKFFKLRATVVDMQHFFRPSLHVDLFNSGATSVLSRRDSKGRHVIVFRVSKWDPSKITFDEYMAGSFLLLDEALSTIDTQYNGMVVVVDLKSLGFSHVRQIGLRRIRTIASLLQDSYPARFKEIHFVNNPAIFGTVYLAAKPFLKEKIVKRVRKYFFTRQTLTNNTRHGIMHRRIIVLFQIFIHGSDVKGLQKIVSLSHLPTSLGGRLTDDTIVNKDAIASILTKDAYYEGKFTIKFSFKGFYIQ